jgi:hypothetical protein
VCAAADPQKELEAPGRGALALAVLQLRMKRGPGPGPPDSAGSVVQAYSSRKRATGSGSLPEEPRTSDSEARKKLEAR